MHGGTAWFGALWNLIKGSFVMAQLPNNDMQNAQLSHRSAHNGPDSWIFDCSDGLD